MINASNSEKVAALMVQGAAERKIAADSRLGKALAQTTKEIRGSFDNKKKFQAIVKTKDEKTRKG